ncbi:MAG: MarR family transcriptional regulator [Fusobacteria bacterium]|jgi:DNA-binding MarR family transcriptional regulator|nr:MarR family transcriptional regulator [Fusobacteriota bacterium]
MSEKRCMIDNQLCFKIYASSRTIIKLYNSKLKKFKMTYPQYLVLSVLWENENITVSDIGNRLYLDSGTLTPLLKKMEILNFIYRKRDEQDERKVIISLTEYGKNIKSEIDILSMEIAKEICVPEDKFKKLMENFDYLLNHLIKKGN